MASGPTRQHYALATGSALNAGDTSTKVKKYAKGGAIKGTGRPGDDKFTSITHKAKFVPKGFKVHRP